MKPLVLDRLFAVVNNTKMERLTGLEAFVRVVETGSFTRAAADLQTAKSSVSEAVKSLEERLGVRLLERTTRHVRPTDAGRLFHARARRALDDLGAARDEVRARQATPAGTIRVAVPESFGERFIVPGLSSFLASFPGVSVELVSEARHVRLVEEAFDLAIRIVGSPSPTLVVRHIGSQRIILVGTQGYFAAHGFPAVPEDLSRHDCVGMAAPLPFHDAWLLGGRRIEVRSRLVASTGEALRAAAIAGLGVVAVPDWLVVDALSSGQLVRVLHACETPVSGIYAVYPTNRLLTPVVRAFVDHLAGHLRARAIPQ